MKRKILFIVLAVVLIAGGILMFGKKSRQTEMSHEEQEVLSAFEHIQQAMIDKDLDTLYASVTEDKTFTHMSGKTQTKEEFFGEIEDGTLNYFQYKIENPQVRFEGDYACLTSTTTLTARVYGFSGSWPLRTEAWFQKIGGEWIYCNHPSIE